MEDSTGLDLITSISRDKSSPVVLYIYFFNLRFFEFLSFELYFVCVTLSVIRKALSLSPFLKRIERLLWYWPSIARKVSIDRQECRDF